MCKEGQYASCADYDYFGNRRDGGFAEYFAAPLWNTVLACDTADYEEIAMAEPCAVGLCALRRGGVKSGGSVAIFGAGPIGLMAAQWAQIHGARSVLIDVDEKKAGFARKMGFWDMFAGGGGDAVRFVRERTNGSADI